MTDHAELVKQLRDVRNHVTTKEQLIGYCEAAADALSFPPNILAALTPEGEDADTLAARDSMLTGTGFVRQRADGTRERIPPEEVFIHKPPAEREIAENIVRDGTHDVRSRMVERIAEALREASTHSAGYRAGIEDAAKRIEAYGVPDTLVAAIRALSPPATSEMPRTGTSPPNWPAPSERERIITKLRDVIQKHEHGENHDEGAFDPDCDICRILQDFRAIADAIEAGEDEEPKP